MRWQKALWDAVGKCDMDLIKDILSLKKVQADLRRGEQVYYDEEAPLHLAAYCGHNDVIEVMIGHGMDVDSFNVYSDKSGFKVTPLHWAVYKNKVGSVRVLLSLGADPHLFGRWGKVQGTPLDFAKKKGLEEMVQILEEYELSDDEYDSDGDDEKEKVKTPDSEIASILSKTATIEAKRKSTLSELSKFDKELNHLRKKLQVLQGKPQENENEKSDEKCKKSESKTNCPICFNVPKHKIYSCYECDNILCNGCKSRVLACPCCRLSFSDKAPRRNRWAEKLVQIEQRPM